MYNTTVFCQSQSHRKYCCNLAAKLIDFPLQGKSINRFFADFKLANDSIQIKLINTTIDTLYLLVVILVMIYKKKDWLEKSGQGFMIR